MCGRIFTALVILIALSMAVLANVLPPERIDYVILVSRFFDIMLPVLAVGALLKYLCSCPWKGHCEKSDNK